MTKFLLFLFSLISLGSFEQKATDTLIIKRLDEYLSSANAANKFNGTALIAKRGKILLNRGYGFKNVSNHSLNDTNTIFQIGSITKSFTSIVILKLQEEGQLSVNDKLSKFFPDYPEGNKITIKNLLTHTSGIYNYTDDIGEEDTAIICYPVSKERVLEIFKNRKLKFSPGKRFEYNNSAYFLLGMIIEKVEGKPYETVVRNLIFNLLQMHHSGFDFRNLNDTNKAQGYVVLQGYGFFVDSLNGRTYVRHSGGLLGFTSDFFYYPKDDVTVILLNNVGNYGNSLMPVAIGISSIVFNLPYSNWQEEKAVTNIPDFILEKYVGIYTDGKTNISITLAKGQLYAESNSKQSIPKLPIYAINETEFFLKDFNVIIEFIKDSNNNVTEFISHENGKNIQLKRIK